MIATLLFAVVSLSASAPVQVDPALCRLGAAVDVGWGGQWWPGTVTADGPVSGACPITYEGFDRSWDEAVTADRIRPRQTASRAPAQSAGVVIHGVTIPLPPSPIQTAGLAVTECVPGQRILADTGQGSLTGTITGPGSRPETCVFLFDELLDRIIDGEKAYAVTSQHAAPHPRMIELGARDAVTDAEFAEMRALAELSHADARVFASRYAFTVNDSLLVSRVCNPDWQSAICQRVNGQFFASNADNGAAIDARNREEAEAARAARGTGEPINSGYYQSGQYSRDVAASQAGRPTASAPSTSAPIAVQSESEIRREQAQCRAGSGPC